MRRALAVALLAACAATALPAWPLEGTAALAEKLATQRPNVVPTGLTRASYLPTIEGIATYFAQQQNAEGRIIDKYTKQEMQYSTPCFALAMAYVAHERYAAGERGARVDDIVEKASRALLRASIDLRNKSCAQGHSSFYTLPVMYARELLIPLVKPAVVAKWDEQLTNIIPTGNYATGGNWAIVAVGGDWFRYKAGLAKTTQPQWMEETLKRLWPMWTDNGLWMDVGPGRLNPVPYDHFPRHYMNVMLHEGCNLTRTADLRALMTRANWVSLLMQSPNGELPTGGRSSQHQWNEAMQAVSYEVMASELKAAGKPQACMFKRSARLALGSVRRWANPTGELQIVKNRFDPALRFGYEGYSYHSQYNLLAASMLVYAALYADESIKECASLPDVGGFVFHVPELQKVIAQGSGIYVEIITKAEGHDNGGLTRIHWRRTGISPLIGPSAGVPISAGEASGIGPYWRVRGEAGAQTLGNTAGDKVSSVSLSVDAGNTPDIVGFTVVYNLASGVVVREHYLLAQDTITVTASVSGKTFDRFGLRMMGFLYDGKYNTTLVVNPAANLMTVCAPSAMGGGSQRFKVVPQAGKTLAWTKLPHDWNTRNGIIRPYNVEMTPVSGNPSLTFTVDASPSRLC